MARLSASNVSRVLLNSSFFSKNLFSPDGKVGYSMFLLEIRLRPIAAVAKELARAFKVTARHFTSLHSGLI